MSQNLTRLAHELALGSLHPGDIAVDATAGNGHDTEFLAKAVGEQGQVYAFDIQQTAIEATRQRLEKSGLSHRASLILAGHENIALHIPKESIGTVATVFFNLGYLPRSNHSIITREPTTLSALEQASLVLRPAGHLSILVYPGHKGGADEAHAVMNWIRAQSDTGTFSFTIHGSPEQLERPWLATGRKS